MSTDRVSGEARHLAAVRVVEVGPRDGLQSETDNVPTHVKVAFIDGLSRSGVRVIEITSFVNPKMVPQLADAAEVLAAIEKRPGVRYSVLIPNVRGLERWLECAHSLREDARAVSFFTAASDEFNRRNTGAGIDDSLARFGEIMDRLRATSTHMPFVRAYVSMAFVSPYKGETIQATSVGDVCARLFESGAEEVSLGDTIGAATPADVDRVLDALLPRFDVGRLAMHFHDTRGTALANVLRSLEYGVSVFDSSAAGLGGCPVVKGASGNVSTEDLLYMLAGMRIETGVNLDVVIAASELIRPHIGHPLASKALEAARLARA